MSVAVLSKTFGWGYFEALRANGAKMGKGSGQVVDDTASGDLVRQPRRRLHHARHKVDKGATLALVYPPEMLVIPSPVAIFKNTPNLDAAKKFVDFVLSKEGQTIIAEEGTLPVRADVNAPERYKLPTATEAMKRAMKIDYKAIMAEKEATIKKFTRNHATEVTGTRIMANIEIRNVSKGYGGKPVLSDLSLQLNDGECFTLLGPLGLRQDGADAPDRRLRGAGRGQHPDRRQARRRRRESRLAADRPARPRHGLPGLCRLAAHDGLQQHRLSAEDRRRR